MIVLALFLFGGIAFLVGLYFLFIKAVDRYEPEPWWLLILCFLWGLLGATTFAIIGNQIGGFAVGLALGDSPLADGTTASVVAPLVEESTKGIGVLFVWVLSALWLKELDGPLDGAIYGGVIGLGFTMLEDFLYVGGALGDSAGLGVAVFTLRTVFAGFGHASFTAMTGLGIGIAAESKSVAIKVIAPIGGWSAAVGLHFLHNFLVSFFGGYGLVVKLLMFWTFDFIFLFLIIVLVLRDRAIIMRGLAGEVGQILHPKELQQITNLYMFVPFWNFFALSGDEHGYWPKRKKQLALINLAFLKRRTDRGETGLDARERDLRHQIQTANEQGIFVGKR